MTSTCDGAANKDELEMLDPTETSGRDSLQPSEPDKHPAVCLHIQRPVFTQQQFEADFQYEVPEAPNKKERIKKLICSCTCSKETLKRMFPFVPIMKKYKMKTDFFNDLVAGLTVGIMHIPQGMAYGFLANTSPVHGLYVSFFAPLIYFFFGTSKHISLGTMAIVSLMVGSAVDKGGCPEETDSMTTTTAATVTTFTTASTPPEGSTVWSDNTTVPSSGEGLTDPLLCRVAVATVLTLMVGIIQLGLGLLRLGFVNIYLSEPLTRAFTTAAACHVFTSQLKYMTGIHVDRHSGVFKLIKMYIDMFRNIASINWASVIMSIISVIILIIFKEFINPKVKAKIKMPVPIELVVIIIATIISYVAQLASRFDMRIVGAIPRGIPAPVLPEFSRLPDFASDAFSIAVVAFAINLSLAKLFAKKHVYSIDSNQELVSYGLTNIVGSMFNCFTNAAALSRSLLQEALGGRTQVAALISCCFLLIILYGAGPLFESLPNCILATIVVVNLKGMFLQFMDIPRLWRVSKPDCMIWVVVFSGTVLLDVDLGLFIGVAFCMLTVVFRTQSPKTQVLGQSADYEIYKDSKVYKKCQESSELRVFQFQSALYYANCEFFISKLFKQTGLNPRNLKKAQQKILRKQKKVEAEQEKANDKNDADPVILMESSAAPALSIPQAHISTIVIDCSVMSYVDSMGASTLEQVIGEYKEVGVSVLLSGCHDGMQETLDAAGFFKKVSRESLFVSVHDAVLFAHSCSTASNSIV